MDEECKKTTDYMESQGIWYIPLKGMLIKELYPRCGMRHMSDYDILVNPDGQEKMQAFMEKRGYERKSSVSAVHDSYYKAPIDNFELHRALFGECHYHIWYEYYKDVKQRLVQDEGCRLRFREENFCVYITVHVRKHHKAAGAGIRTLMDFYVYNNAKSKSLDWDYIKPKLEKLELTEFEQMSRELAFILFSTPDMDSFE